MNLVIVRKAVSRRTCTVRNVTTSTLRLSLKNRFHWFHSLTKLVSCWQLFLRCQKMFALQWDHSMCLNDLGNMAKYAKILLLRRCGCLQWIKRRGTMVVAPFWVKYIEIWCTYFRIFPLWQMRYADAQEHRSMRAAGWRQCSKSKQVRGEGNHRQQRTRTGVCPQKRAEDSTSFAVDTRFVVWWG